MKHVLLVHQAFVSPRQAGGTRHYEFAQLLTPTGEYRFTIVASTLSYLTGQQAKSTDDAGLPDGIEVLRAYTLPVVNRSFVWRVIAFLSFMVAAIWKSRAARNIDVVMGTTPPIFQSVSAWVIAFIRRRPFLLEVRDLWPEFAIDMGVLKNPVLIRLSRWLETFLYNRADHILVNSPAYRDYMINRGIPAEKVSLIPNGVDPNMFYPDADGNELRQRYDLVGKFVITYAGALGQANDIGTILNTAKLLSNEHSIHFLLVGDGKEKPKLEQIVSEYDLKNVTFTGALPKTDMPSLLAATDVCLASLMNIPMFKTTYPNKVFDYMAAARPTVLAIDGVIRDVLEAANGGIFVPPGDSTAMAQAITTLRDDPVSCKRMGRSARDYVVGNFNRRDQVQLFAQLIDRMTEAR